MLTLTSLISLMKILYSKRPKDFLVVHRIELAAKQNMSVLLYYTSLLVVYVQKGTNKPAGLRIH